MHAESIDMGRGNEQKAKKRLWVINTGLFKGENRLKLQDDLASFQSSAPREWNVAHESSELKQK